MRAAHLVFIAYAALYSLSPDDYCFNLLQACSILSYEQKEITQSNGFYLLFRIRPFESFLNKPRYAAATRFVILSASRLIIIIFS